MTFYPDRVYPESPDFPSGHDDVPLGDDLYQTSVSYITSLVASLTPFLDYLGNIELGATEGISWGGVEQIDLSGATIVMQSIAATTFICDDSVQTIFAADGDLIIGNDFLMLGTTSDLSVAGTISQDHVDRDRDTLTQAAEPGDPADNTAVFWCSSGTGAGDAGDFMCKITEGGGTTTFTIADYTAL